MKLSWVDTLLLLAYFALVSWIAWRSCRESRTARSFLIGEREIPWWAAMLSIIGTEMSALTFVGVPAFAYGAGGNYTYLVGAVGMVVARIIVSRWFVPAYYRYNVVSIYELLERRFGAWTRSGAVLVFLFTRVAMSGVRLYAGSIVVQVALGIPWQAAILCTAALGLVYTILGGIRSVIWTEVLQVVVMFGGAVAAAALLFFSLPDGWNSVAQATQGLDKFRLLDTRFNMCAADQEFTVWAALLGLTMFNLSVFGTDYDMVQRMLTTRDAARSARAVITSALADVPINALFLTIGVLLFSYYHFFPDLALPSKAKDVFPHFIMTRIPHGLVGLVVAGLLSVALSSYQSALNALAASFTVDVYRRHLVTTAPEEHYVKVSRTATVGFAVLLVAVAFWASDVERILILGLEIPSYTYCALLGVFLTGILTRRGSDLSCTLAMVLTVPFVFFVCHRYLGVAWTWNALLGTLFSLAICLGLGWTRRWDGEEPVDPESASAEGAVR